MTIVTIKGPDVNGTPLIRRSDVVLITGGLAADEGLMAALTEAAVEQKAAVEIRSHPQSMLAGAIGAALWGAFRARRLAALGRRPASAA